MKSNTAFKMAMLYFYMYFIGPLIWGVWMIYRLKIITLQEYLHCLLSLSVLIMLSLYFLVNTLFAIRFMIKISTPPSENRQRRISGMTALKINSISVITFGTVGTFVFLSMLSTNFLSFSNIVIGSWVGKAIIGALSGAALVFVFFIFFSTTIMTTIISKMKETLWEEEIETLALLRRENHILYVIGLILFVGSSAASLVYNGILTSGDFFAIGGMLFLAALSLPVLMSWLLFRKSGRKIDRLLSPSDSKQRTEKKTKLRYSITAKYVVQAAAMLLFIILLLMQRSRFWLILLIAGFISSLLFGRIYCGWLCPVNTLSSLIEKLFKRLKISKFAAPKWLDNKIAGRVFFALFLIFFILSLILQIRPQLFLIISLLGILASTVFASSVWCNFLCPWGMILKCISRFSLFRLFLRKDHCIKCGKCSLNCPTKSLVISQNEQDIDFSRCLQCLRCIDKCEKNAIVIQKCRLADKPNHTSYIKTL